MIIDGAALDGACPYHGEGDVAIVPAPGDQSRVQQGVDQPTYSLMATFPSDTPPMAVTGPCAGGFTNPYPLADKVFMGTVTSQRSSSSTLVDDTTVVSGSGTIKSAWRPRRAESRSVLEAGWA